MNAETVISAMKNGAKLIASIEGGKFVFYLVTDNNVKPVTAKVFEQIAFQLIRTEWTTETRTFSLKGGK